MGLNIVVGILVSMPESEDEEGFKIRQDEFSRVNKALREAGLPEHHEPVDLGGTKPFDVDMYEYSGLHYLRRIAAYEWAGKALPPPGGEDSDEDPIVKQYYSAAVEVEKKRTHKGLLRRAPPDQSIGIKSEHLMCHSDAEGFYVPIDFEHVVFDTKKVGIPGDILGSTQRLMEECKTLAKILELPLELDPDSEEVWKPTENQGQGDTQWKRYGIESFSCLRLFHACKASLAMRAAIVFQ